MLFDRGTAAQRLVGVGLDRHDRPPRMPPSEVISMEAPQSRMRSASEPALKPPKTTLWMAPMRAQASMAMASSGIIGR